MLPNDVERLEQKFDTFVEKHTNMHLEFHADVLQRLVRIEAFKNLVEEDRLRIRSLEQNQAKAKGALAILAALWGIVGGFVIALVRKVFL